MTRYIVACSDTFLVTASFEETVLEELRTELEQLRRDLLEDPPFLTASEKADVLEAEAEYARGESISQAQLEKDLGE